MVVEKIGNTLIVDGMEANVHEVKLVVYDYGDNFYDVLFTKAGDLFGESFKAAIFKSELDRIVKFYEEKTGLQHCVEVVEADEILF